MESSCAMQMNQWTRKIVYATQHNCFKTHMTGLICLICLPNAPLPLHTAQISIFYISLHLGYNRRYVSSDFSKKLHKYQCHIVYGTF